MPYTLFPPGKRGPYWTIRGTIAGQRFESSTRQTDRKAAEAWAIAYVADRQNSPDGIGTIGPVTYPQAAAAYRLYRKPRGKEVARHDRLDGYFGGRLVEDLKHAHLVAAANALFPKGAAGTKNREVISVASAVLHYAAEQEWCAYRKFRRFAEPRRSNRRPARDEDVARLMEATTGHQRLFLSLAYETGLRLGSILGLRDDQYLDLAAGTILVEVGKTGERVELHLSPALVALIGSTDRCDGNRLLPWRSASGVYRWLRPLCKRLKITYTPHMSRHALATDLLRAGVPDKTAAAAGAWRDVQSLHRYQHVETSDLPARNSGDLRGKLKLMR